MKKQQKLPEEMLRLGRIEEYLRETQPLSEPDCMCHVVDAMVMASGIRVYLPRFEVYVQEGIFVHADGTMDDTTFDNTITVIVEKSSGKLLFDEEESFLETVCHWLNETIPIEELAEEPCKVEGIRVQAYEKGVVHNL